MIDTLVIGGGGVCGLCFLGALENLFKKTNQNLITKMSGSSVGSIICCLLSVGYTPTQIYEVLLNYDFKNFNIDLDIKCIDNFIDKLGLNSADEIMKLFQVFLNKKCDIYITFKEHYEKFKIELTINGTNINSHDCKYFNYKETPDCKIIDAVRISISIPFIFTTCTYENDTYVDGAISNMYPINYYNDLDKCIGLFVNTPPNIHSINNMDDSILHKYFHNFTNLCMAIIKSLQQDTKRLIKKLYNEYTVYIESDIPTSKFNIDNEDKIKLFNFGKSSFDQYYKLNKDRFIKKNK